MRLSFLSISILGLLALGGALIPCPEAFAKVRILSSVVAPAQAYDTILNLGPGLGRELKGGEAHEFVVKLQPGQFLHVDVEQIGIDVEVTLQAPDGAKLLTVDSPNDQYGPELVVWKATVAGEHKVQVRSGNNKALSGRYRITLVALGTISGTNETLIGAARAFEEAQRLRTQRTAPTRAAAIKKFEKALSGFQLLQNQYWSGLSLHSLGSTYYQSSELPQALAAFNKALPFFRGANDKRREAGVYNFIGGINDVLGNQAQALADFEKALAILASVEDPSTRASLLNNIGKVYSDLNQWQLSLDFYNEALPIMHTSGNARREATSIYNIGLLYHRLGDAERALSQSDQALKLFRLAEDKEGQANTLGLIGLVHVTRGEFQRGLDFYSQALTLRRAGGDPRGEATTLDYAGFAYARLNQPQKALAHHQQALELRRKVSDRRNEALSLSNLGYVYDLLDDAPEALKHYQQALETFRAMEDRDNAARTLVGIARVESKRSDFQAARLNVEEALGLIEQVRSATGAQQLRASYFASKQEAYKLYIDLLMKQHTLKPEAGHDAEALAANERARARSLLELLTEARVDIRKSASPELIQREQSLSQLLNAKAQRQIRLLGQKNVQEQLNEVNQEIRGLEDEYQQVQTAIRRASPEYAALTQPQPLNLKELQNQLDEDTLLLEYSLGEPRSYLWVVSRTALHSYELPRAELIQAQARKVYEFLTSRSTTNSETAAQRKGRIDEADAKFPVAAAELSQMVLSPIAAQLAGKRLVIVADGALQFVPFAALPAPGSSAVGAKDNYKPLVLNHEIVSLPSASALAVQRNNLRGRQPAVNAVAVIADPVFSTDDERFKLGFKETAASHTSGADDTRILEHLASGSGKLRIKRLPFTRQEATQILAVAPQTGNLKAIDFKASRATAISPELSKYRYVHFATHGYLDSERPDLSALVLSLVDKEGQMQDGFLRAREIYNLTLPAELVVLSACQTGLGKEIKGEGLVGLTRGFMYAGARRVVVSLWNVNDKATADLMQRFYRGMLREGQTPSAALRKAQTEMWERNQWQAPYYWAAFILQGEWK